MTRIRLWLLAAVAVALFVRVGVSDEPLDWLDKQHIALRGAVQAYEDGGRKNPSEVAFVLDELARLLRSRPSAIRSEAALDELMVVLAELSKNVPYDVRTKVWAAAAATCHKAGIAILEGALSQGAVEDATLVTGLSGACRDAKCGRAHVWFVEHAPKLHERATSESVQAAVVEALRASIACIGGCDVNDDGKRAARSIESAARKLLKKAPEPLERELVVALALAPSKASRVLLRKWYKKKKDAPEATLVAMLAALGKAGDADVIPLLLDHMPKTSPAVLEEAIVALHALPVEVLKAHGKRILGTTIELADEEGRDSGSLSGNAKRNRKQDAQLALNAARYDAWQTRRILDDPPRPLPDGATGLPGISALWWRIIDAGPKGVTPPEPPAGAAIKYMNHRPNMVGVQWSLWWQNTK